ncbi:hypothetical protein [Pseudonocardia aurantiaca]|uniref:MFS transporter n=1 Tax=Pseudonocardia aurantiaca TaxID=75290 RepID=A0ABW4FQS7_9PSEU
MIVPYVFSGLRESTGSWAAACIVGAALCVLAAGLFLIYGLLGRRHARRQPAEVAVDAAATS